MHPSCYQAVVKLSLKQSKVLVQLKNVRNHAFLKLSSTCHQAFAELSRNCHQELTSSKINLKGVFILQSMSWMFGVNLTFFAIQRSQEHLFKLRTIIHQSDEKHNILWKSWIMNVYVFMIVGVRKCVYAYMYTFRDSWLPSWTFLTSSGGWTLMTIFENVASKSVGEMVSVSIKYQKCLSCGNKLKFQDNDNYHYEYKYDKLIFTYSLDFFNFRQSSHHHITWD